MSGTMEDKPKEAPLDRGAQEDPAALVSQAMQELSRAQDALTAASDKLSKSVGAASERATARGGQADDQGAQVGQLGGSPEREYGWQVFSTDEEKRAAGPTRAGDQWRRFGDMWLPVGATEAEMGLGLYRRRVDPGAGWEVVPLGDVVSADAQVLCGSSEEWVPQGWHSHFGRPATVAECVAEAAKHGTVIAAFRRRKLDVHPALAAAKAKFEEFTAACAAWDRESGQSLARRGVFGNFYDASFWLAQQAEHERSKLVSEAVKKLSSAEIAALSHFGLRLSDSDSDEA